VGLTESALHALVEPWRGDEGQAAFYRQVAQAEERYTDELEPLLPRLALPVLVVWGREDTWIPVDRAHRLAGLIPGSRLRLIDGAGHLVQLDQPVALSVTLTEWLAAQGTST
jgi:pimeloyl-ACP methyl ester carboxylesterase